MRIQGSYETQDGSGTITSSPGFRTAAIASYIASFAPQVTMTWPGVQGNRFSRVVFSAMAERSSGIPLLGA